jgi:hypothetical protein
MTGPGDRLGSAMPKKLVMYAAMVLVLLGALLPHPVAASEFRLNATAIDVTDADFCFGPGNQAQGFACNSICFGSPDPDFYSQPITCPGPPASIRFEPASLLTAYCGSQSTLSVVVADAKGIAVADATQVSFTTDGGRVGETSATRGGLALTTFLIHPDATGVAHVVATVGSKRKRGVQSDAPFIFVRSPAFRPGCLPDSTSPFRPPWPSGLPGDRRSPTRCRTTTRP